MATMIFYAELSLEEGFNLLSKPKKDRLLRGRQVSACSGFSLFRRLQHQPICCWNCGCQADRWVADKGRNDLIGSPVLNLYGTRADGRLVLMNRDHIIPQSLGGSDAIENLRPACAVCNIERGNLTTQEELDFRAANPHLINQKRYEAGKQKAEKHTLKETGKRDKVIPQLPGQNTPAEGKHLKGIRKRVAITEHAAAFPPRTEAVPEHSTLVEGPEIETAVASSFSLMFKNENGKFQGPYMRHADFLKLFQGR